MARFTAYDKKAKPDDTDTLLIYDDDASPDTLKQIDIKALFESYDSTTYDGQNKTVQEAIEDIINGSTTFSDPNNDGNIVITRGAGT